MVLGWFNVNKRQRSNTISEGDTVRAQPALVEEMQEQLSSRWIQSEDNLTQVMAESPQQALQEIQPRRRSLFDIRAPFASDRFSREYADATDDMWIAECDQGDAGHAGKGIMEGPLFQRRVALGQDEFSREYFDTTGDLFVAETDFGDSGYLHGNPHQPTFNRIPEALRRFGKSLLRPVKVGSDHFSREYAREGEDVWLAQAGKSPSDKLAPSLLMRRVSLEYADTSNGDRMDQGLRAQR